MHKQHQIACQSHIVDMTPHRRISYQPRLDTVSTMTFPPLSYHLNFLWPCSLPSNLHVCNINTKINFRNNFHELILSQPNPKQQIKYHLIVLEGKLTFIFGHIKKRLELQSFSVVHHTSHCINENASIKCNVILRKGHSCTAMC